MDFPINSTLKVKYPYKGRITLEFEIPNIEGEEERIIDGKSDNLVHDS